MRIARILTFAVLVCLHCGSPMRGQPVDAKAELQAAIEILKKSHINRDRIDWLAVEAKANAIAEKRGLRAIDAYPAIQFVINELGERHTFLISREMYEASISGKQTEDYKPPAITPPQGYQLAGNVGLLQVKYVQGSDEVEAAYIAAARKALQAFAAAGICRYIIDLRANTGGNMFPMMHGLSSLLGAEPYGYWVSHTKPMEPWEIIKGSGLFRFPGVGLLLPAWQSRAPVAVLIDQETGSSGEFTAMAFKGRSNTRFFGEKTAGFLTGNRAYVLPDGGRLYVSESWGADRKRVAYRTSFEPDVITGRGQETLDSAITWLKQQPCPSAPPP